MKKIITYLLLIAMAVALCACGPKEEAKKPDVLKVGFAKIDITPDFEVGLAGYSDATTRKNTDDPVTQIYATCIAATSGDETVLIFTVDTVQMRDDRQKELRVFISSATGVADDHIFMGATHSHNCPDPASRTYNAFLKDKMVAVAKEAMADRSEATVLTATPTIEKMNSVRHFLLKDGTYAGSNFGDMYNAKNPPVAQAAKADNQMVLVKFDRGTEKKPVLMMNWQAHPDSAKQIGYNSIAASWIGPLRDKLTEDTGMLVAYFTGASGNVNKDSRISGETNSFAWRQYGEELARLTEEHLDELKPVEGTAIHATRALETVNIDHSWTPMLPEAMDVWNTWESGDTTAANAMAIRSGFTSAFQARAIIARAKMQKTAKLEVGAFSIGGVGFVTGTYEMFSSASLYIKENSKFDTTFVITGCYNYIPDRAAFEYRCYEADTGYYEKGTSEQLSAKMVELLNQFK